jgi:hypothetical protein
MIAGQLFYDTPKENENWNTLNKIIAFYFIFVPLVGLPVTFFWMFTKTLSELRQEKF